ncbi:hypothetical protein E9549_22365 [Blastococcus sp. MG754426]|uniref:hypothetical protein n=1 Tax=unclassified Blastococcus TaxID=2619396 RepID=UPI001EF12004|nr:MULTISPECIES: hypothetical protein [unclassified Blastococcus]MCF6510112.1 hypothetical protein [Blastococcus sp. MG754426]MCF6514483.1 hypothetical protein [Blastococcus sp. MG754427]MCF6737698.1 hypothetical protein [Blastococcus sp. KM273129]
MESDEADARAQLAALRADRVALAERVVQPWWYDALLGLLTFLLFASYSFAFPWLTLGALVVYLAGLRGLVAVYRRLTGAWVSGDRPGPTRRAYTAWLVGATLVVVPALVLELALDVGGAMVVAGAVLGVGIALVSRWWTRIYVAELRGEL